MALMEPITIDELRAHRREHFARLQQPPELYLELMVPSSSAYDLCGVAGRAGHVPTAGCAHDNVASQKTLCRAGFISRHSLIEFQLGSSTRL